jgi:hypothetical protein
MGRICWCMWDLEGVARHAGVVFYKQARHGHVGDPENQSHLPHEAAECKLLEAGHPSSDYPGDSDPVLITPVRSSLLLKFVTVDRRTCKRAVQWLTRENSVHHGGYGSYGGRRHRQTICLGGAGGCVK